MPALVKSNVGSLAGTSEEECTRRCPFDSKKRRNSSRISFPVRLCIALSVYRAQFSKRNVVAPSLRDSDFLFGHPGSGSLPSQVPEGEAPGAPIFVPG